MIRIANAHLSAELNPQGGELWSLQDAAGRQLMTDADPAFWTGHAPLLFPIVGALNGGVYRLDGQEYALPQHGFARRRSFETIEQGPDHVRFRLTDDAETRAAYPFAFALEPSYVLDGVTLAIDVTVTNRDTRDMPVSFGFHPAFAWPLPYGGTKQDHRIRFEQDEPAPLRQLIAGGISLEPRPSPLDGRDLMLRDDLFTADALIWDRLESRSVRYGRPEGPWLDVAFPDTSMLGIWTKPGARFVCIEPWHGIADPVGFDGAIWDKPGIERLRPREAQTFSMRVSLVD
jgi:galactose mutarotase-like enzyme